MPELPAAPVPADADHAATRNVLLGLAVAQGLLLFFGGDGPWPGRLGSWLGFVGSIVLFRYARSRKRAARAQLTNGVAARGRISEKSTPSETFLEIRDTAVEPWAADAGVIAVLSFAAWWLSTMTEMGHRGPLVVCAIALGLLGGRLLLVRADHLKFEISNNAWAVDGMEGGRHVHRAGKGCLRPELTRDALILWSDEGRVGVLRGELEPEERIWLGARMGQLAQNAPPPVP